ncbi:MAG: flagellar export chaperone FliS [Rickettsiales bacterium]|nr:flagellar export chaperone FliS [Rickettsiales bacterium]
MTQQENYHAYRRAIHTVGKSRQIVMLYDGVISSLQQARDAMAQGRAEDRFNLLSKASQIVMGLQSSLDFDSGKLIAATLYDFYSGILFQMNSMNRHNDMAQCQAVIEEIKSMRQVWDEIDRQETQENGAQSLVSKPEGDTTPMSPTADQPTENITPSGGISVSA